MTGERARGVWWLSPPGAVALVIPPTLGLAVYFDDAHFRAAWDSPKTLTGSTAMLFAAGALMFVLGGLLPLLQSPRTALHQWPGFSPRSIERLRLASHVLFGLTMLGYVAFAIAGAARGATPTDFLTAFRDQNNFSSPLRSLFAPVPGFTTLTQLGIAYVIVAALLLRYRRDAQTVRRLVLVLALALLRTFFLAERLAVIELVIPAAAVVALSLAASQNSRHRALVRFTPLILLPAVMLFFSIFEYSRSWVFYSARSSGSFGEFILDRLAGYYSTAYNNGQLSLLYEADPARLPFGSIEAVWTAPVVAQLGGYERLTGIDPSAAYFQTIDLYANPEFNSPGGLAIPFLDYGTAGGLLYFFIVGMLIGLAYRRCCEGSVWAVLLYPALVTGLFELPRYLYWGQGRVLPALVALLLVRWFVERDTRVRETSGALT